MAISPGKLRKVRAKHHLALAISLHEVHQLWRIVPWGIRRSVNVDILMLPCNRDHLICPWVANVPTYDLELWKVQCDAVDMRYWSAWLTRVHRPSVTHLGHEGYSEFNALGKQGVEVVGGRRHVPEPWNHSNSFEALSCHVVLKLFGRCCWLPNVHSSNANKSIWGLVDKGRYYLIGDDRPLWSTPCTHKDLLHLGLIHHAYRVVD
mmetsp:Transcript_70240/g.131347  ORF Transcript_70240/g.131347 Transcript_70240/m.131347 type:complete len:206 (+) Transcript_70240:134-751(+)